MPIAFKQHPALPQGFSHTFIERFWKYVNKYGPTPKHVPELGACWIWMGAIHGWGYGRIGIGGRPTKWIRAHRASWLLHTGSTTDKCILHKCDNPACVNPDHLFEGSLKDNMLDKERKGRGNHPNGEKLSTKLSWEIVNEIRKLKSESKITNLELARKFGCGTTIISNIVHNKKWKSHSSGGIALSNADS